MTSVGSVIFVTLAAIGEPANAGNWAPGLTDRELAIGRWFAHLTFMQDRNAAPWPEWHDDGKQLGITSLRYQLAFAGYGCAAMAAKTPAYRDLVERQLRDLCERMIDSRVWRYVAHYWNYGDEPPDPCQRDNVMYAGHLTQLMCLYELLTGDQRYSTCGWCFAWHDGRKTHYTLRKAVERLHAQSVKSPTGGICCEPSLVFAACNSHSAASFLLHDVLHGTRFADANDRWFNSLSRDFRIEIPSATNLFYVAYHEGKRFFLPAADVGADCWTVGWSYPSLASNKLAKDGWTFLLNKAQWHSSQPDMLFAQNNILMSCCGGTSLSVSNSFVPLVAFQVEGKGSETGRKVLRWLEAGFGRSVDMDGDGVRESYYYHTDDALRIATTGNIAAAIATDGDSLRQLFRTARRAIHSAPTVRRVDYPNVYVRAAQYRSPVLRFIVCRGNAGFRGQTEIVCDQIPGKVAVTRNGEPYSGFSHSGSTLSIHTDVDREHVFEVTADAFGR